MLARARGCELRRLCELRTRPGREHTHRVRLLPAEGRMSKLALLLALLAGTSGCAAGARLTADRRDYTLYRETRVAATPELRLGASGRYLKEEPNGRFRAEVERSFARV